MKIKKTLVILSLFLSFCWGLNAQTSGTSPYSKIGIGDIVSPNLNHIRNMGGTGISFTDIYMVNTANPASYSYLKTTGFDLGLYAKRSTLEDEYGSVNVWSGNINNITLAFPMRNPINDILDRIDKKYSWGMAFNLTPYSLVGYNLSSEEYDPNYGNYSRNYIGKGGTYKFQWGNSISYKDFSIGLHLGYLFGNIDYNKSVVFDDLSNPYNDYYSVDYHVSGFLYDIGLLYNVNLNKKLDDGENKSKLNKLTFGLTLNSKTSFSTNADLFNISQQLLTGLRDTTDIENLEGEGTLPSQIGFGVNYYSGNKWSIGINYRMSNWSQFINDVDPIDLTDSYRVSFGGFYRPNPKSYSNFFNRVYYQFGGYYQKDPRSIQDKTIDSYGLTLGLGLPYVYKRKISHANIGIDIGRKGVQSPIKENYIKFNFGFTFNDDSWFLKRKYN